MITTFESPKNITHSNIDSSDLPLSEIAQNKVAVGINWNRASHSYDEQGSLPSCTMDIRGNVVEVHKGFNTDKLSYRRGKIIRDSNCEVAVRWDESSHVYDHSGNSPSVAINEQGIVIEVHKGANGNELHYRVGHLSETDENKIVWEDNSHKYDKSGKNPRVAIRGNHIVEVHRGKNSKKLFYHVGLLDSQNMTVKWSQSKEYDRLGNNPSVAISQDYRVVEVHKGENTNRLYYRVGQLQRQTMSIHWDSDSHKYDESGATPTVAVDDFGRVLEVHSGANGHLLHYRVGLMGKGFTVEWASSSVEYDGIGFSPVVAINNNGQVVAVHKKTNSLDRRYDQQLYYRAGKWEKESCEQKEWMNSMPGFTELTLKEATIPATHDSGSYAPSENYIIDGNETIYNLLRTASTLGLGYIGKFLSQAQNKTIYQQLCDGIRWFDLRVCYTRDDVFLHHGQVVCARASEAIDDIARFVRETRGELIIVNIKRFNEFTSQVHEEFQESIISRLSEVLIPPKPSDIDSTILDIKIENLMARAQSNKEQSRVILFYANSARKRKYFFNNDCYLICNEPNKVCQEANEIAAATVDFLRENREEALENCKNSKFLLSLAWNLDGTGEPNKSHPYRELIKLISALIELPLSQETYVKFVESYQLYSLSILANPSLLCFMESHLQSINRISVNFYQLSDVVDISIKRCLRAVENRA